MVMHTPLISIAIPAYNCDRYIAYSIQSVLSQTFEDWELILLNDGSTDHTSEIMQSYAKRDRRIRVIDGNKNCGLIRRLNQSVALARGKYYARMDGDDIMHPERLKTQISYLLAHPDVNVLGSTAYAIDENNIITAYLDCAEFPNPARGHGFIHPSVMASTEWFRRNPYSENYNRIEDYELWLRAFSHSKYYVIQLPLIFYRDSGTTTPRKYLATHISALKIAFSSHLYEIGFRTRVRIALGSLLRILACTSFFIIGKSQWLLKMRKSRKKIKEISKAQIDLRKAINS